MSNVRFIGLGLFTILVILLICCVLSLFSGCKCTMCGEDDAIQTTPTPTEQLWQAVKKSNWLVTISILGVAAGAFAFLNGSKIGLPAIGASCISLFMALAVARFATWMAICGLIGSILAVIISVLVKNKALKEFICNIQNIKKAAKDNGNTISEEAIEGILSKQVKSTKKVVQKVKNVLKLKGEIE